MQQKENHGSGSAFRAAEPMIDESEDSLRAATYALLGRLLNRPPEESLFAQLAESNAGASEQGLAHAWYVLARAAGHADPAQVREEFQDLFIGIGRGELVPYGSWYLTGFLMERPLAELRADLQRLGIERQGTVREPEDHIAALCEVMSLLICDPQVTFETERDFFSKHLAPWAGRFFKDLEASRGADFYRAVASLGREFTSVEQQSMSMMA